MADVGYAVAGGGSQHLNGVARGSIFTMPVDGVVTSMTANLGAGGAHNVRLAVYDAATVAAAVLLDYSSIRSDIGAVDWYTFTGFAGVTIPAGTQILLAGVGDTTNVELAYDAAGSGYTATSALTPPTSPADFTSAGTQTRTYSVYLTYTPAGGGPSSPVILLPQRSRRHSHRFM